MKRDYRSFFAFCKMAGRDYKEVVLEFTEGRTDSLRELGDREYLELLIVAKGFNKVPVSWKPAPGDAQRKKMIALAKQMNWGNGDRNVLLIEIDEWLLKQPKFAARLNALSLDQLGRALYVFEHKVFADFMKGLNK